jgi:hypothetical protein
MCENCWHKEGSPAIETPKVRRLAADIRGFLKEFPGGGGLHIVLDDWNLKRAHIRWCQREGQEYGWNALADRVAAQMLKMSAAQRASALALAEDYWR